MEIGSSTSSPAASTQAQVSLQKGALKQEEAVVMKILEGTEGSSPARTGFSTGGGLNVTG